MKRALLLAAAGIGGYLAYRALKPRYDFRDKHVMITGGSRALGLVACQRLTSFGFVSVSTVIEPFFSIFHLNFGRGDPFTMAR